MNEAGKTALVESEDKHENKLSTALKDSSMQVDGIQIRHIYLKGISMIQPNSPAVLFGEGALQIQLNVNVGASQLGGDNYEASIAVSVRAKSNELTVYEIEVQQAGIFTISGFDDEKFGAAIGVDCARVLYPYARSYIADTVTRAGFVPLHLGEIDFRPVSVEREKEFEVSEDV